MAQDAECLEPLVDKPYVCHTCGVRYQTKRSLQRHNAEKHHERVVKKSIDSGDGDAKPFTCETCGKKYQESKSLRRHIRDYHSGVYFGITMHIKFSHMTRSLFKCWTLGGDEKHSFLDVGRCRPIKKCSHCQAD